MKVYTLQKIRLGEMADKDIVIGVYPSIDAAKTGARRLASMIPKWEDHSTVYVIFTAQRMWQDQEEFHYLIEEFEMENIA